jgi:AcrR family transcriptional regulator
MSENNYHHGDLRNAIISEGMSIIKKEGIEGLSIRHVARKIGVSHTAPYRHFRDHDDLLAAIAVRGFKILRDDIQKVLSKFPDDSGRQILESGKTYIRFAMKNPDLYRIMFRDYIKNKTGKDDFYNEMDFFFREWVGYLAKIKKVDSSGEDIVITLLLIWSALHGYSSLVIDNNKDKNVGSDKQVDLIVRKLLNFIN